MRGGEVERRELLEDPKYLSDGFSGTLNRDYTPDFENCRYDCDPEVATRFTLP